jgi:NAD(P)-dependent dehydrogenase (short-subunit alcohol dehydrogenase family)
MRLANKVAIITGASSGIGRASAYLFAKEGAKVVVVANINDFGGTETTETIIKNGGSSIFVHGDVSQSVDVQNIVKTTIENFGKIDILFNNAGIGFQRTPMEVIEEARWDKIYATNVKSIFLCVKYVVPEMRKGGSGVIINTGSMSGIRPRMYDSPYGSAKSAVNLLTKSLALELAPFIRVNCINPGPILTGIIQKGPGSQQFQKDIAELPLKRAGTPDDIAFAALYLASDESSFVTGTLINVDGGRGI